MDDVIRHEKNAYNCVYATENLDLDLECELCPVAPEPSDERVVMGLGEVVVSDEPRVADQKLSDSIMEVDSLFTIPTLVQARILTTEQLTEEFRALGNRLLIEMPEGRNRDEAIHVLSTAHLIMVRGMALD